MANGPDQDPRYVPLRRGDTFKWESNGTTKITPIEGTGGFVLVRFDDKQPPIGTAYTVHMFVAHTIQTFECEKPDDGTWYLIDVPKGFSINNGDALVPQLPPGGGPPTIVHGNP